MEIKGGNGDRGGNGDQGRSGDQGGNGGQNGNSDQGRNGNQNGNGDQGGSGDQGGNQGANRRKGRKILKALGKFAVGTAATGLKTGLKLTSAVALGAAGAATGNLSTAISGATTGYSMASNLVQSHERKAQQRELAKAYRDQEDIYKRQGRDDNWIRQHTKDLLNGDIEAEDYERDYYNAAMKAKDYYTDRGMGEEESVSAVDKDINGIQNGYIGETAYQRFTGRILNRRNRNNNP